MLETESNGVPAESNGKSSVPSCKSLPDSKGESHQETENHVKNVGEKQANNSNMSKDANSGEGCDGQEARDEKAPLKGDGTAKGKQDLTLRLQNVKSKLSNSSKVKSSKNTREKSSESGHTTDNNTSAEKDDQPRGKTNLSNQVNDVKSQPKGSSAKITRNDARSLAKVSKKSKPSSNQHSQPANQVVAKKSSVTPPTNTNKNEVKTVKNKKKRKKSSPIHESPVSNEDEDANGEPRTSKRIRSQYQPFQSPEALAMLAPSLYKPISKPPSAANKNNDEKIVVFSKGDFLAVRNEEGTFFVCRAAQNVYKSSRRFKIHWLNDEKEPGVYTPDFYDQTDFECVLTNLKMERKAKGKYILPLEERKRTMNILERAINVEKGLSEVPDPRHVVMDGVDVSIVGKEEEQELIKISPKQKIKANKEKPAKISGKPKRSSTHEEKEPSIKERRRSSETNHKSPPIAVSSKRKEKSSNSISIERSPEERRSTRSTSRSIIPEKKSSSSNKSSSSSSLRKRRLTNDPIAKVVIKPEIKSSKSSYGDKHSENVSDKHPTRQSTTLGVVNMSVHEAKRPKIRISLIPNPKVSEQERELTFDSKEEVPYISTIVDSKLLIRAVNRKDYELIDKMITDGKICSFCVPRSINTRKDALSYAIQREDLTAIKILMDKNYLANFTSFPDVLITRSPGKKQNILIMGQTNSTPEAMEVLLLDLSHNYDYRCLRQRTFLNSEIIREALKFGITVATIDKLCSLECDKSCNILTLLLNNISVAVKYGHREIAYHLVQIAIKKGGFGFHTLHKEALQEKDLFSIAKPSLVSTRSISNCNITPIHCAAINPDEYYISTLLESHSDSYSVQDTEGWHPIHYAAVCESKGPLKYLISKGIPTLVRDKEGNTPLHLACLTGRVHNVELILSHEANNSGDKHSCIEKQNKEGLTPLHIACEKGKDEIVKILLQSGADAEKVTLTGNDKLTPLMIAAQNGHLTVVKMLVEKGVDVEAVDRRDRTALLHAIINGYSHVVSYLLRLGANPDTKESFGNTSVHFAVAYGWYFTLKLLIQAGAKLNEPNICNITPLMIGYIKGHLGLVELLTKEGVTLDSQVSDSSGQTLLMETIKTRPGKSMIDRIQFLAKNKADFTKADREGNNAFHYLADYGEYLVDEPDSPVTEESEGDDFCSEDEELAIKRQELNHRKINRVKKREKHLKYLTETIKLLTDNGCDYAACNNLKETCFHKAAKYGYFDLIEALLESGCEISESVNEDGNSLLHLILRHAPYKCVQLLPSLKKHEGTIERLKKMTKIENRLGEVPLASALINYKSLDRDEQDKKLIHFLIDNLDASVKINVPLENVKTETCVNFVTKYCTPEIVAIIQSKLDQEKKDPPAEKSAPADAPQPPAHPQTQPPETSTIPEPQAQPPPPPSSTAAATPVSISTPSPTSTSTSTSHPTSTTTTEPTPTQTSAPATSSTSVPNSTTTPTPTATSVLNPTLTANSTPSTTSNPVPTSTPTQQQTQPETPSQNQPQAQQPTQTQIQPQPS